MNEPTMKCCEKCREKRFGFQPIDGKPERPLVCKKSDCSCHAQPVSQEGRVCSKCLLIMASCSVGEITKEEAVEKVRSHGCDVVAEKWAEGKLKIMSCR